MKFSTYIIKKNKYETSTEFFADKKLPKDSPITTPFCFPIVDKKILLTLDKNSWWNPLGGHIEQNENWIECLKREVTEEGGVEISDPELFGYVKATTISGKNNYPKQSILPFTFANIENIDENWVKKETKDRGLFEYEDAMKILSLRKDNNQMLEIFRYFVENFKDNLNTQKKYSKYHHLLEPKFEWIDNEILDNLPSKQAYCYCLYKDKIVLVREKNEKMFTLPGGSIEINESNIEAIKRELKEEISISAKKEDLKFLGYLKVTEYEYGIKKSYLQLRYYLILENLNSIKNNKNSEIEEIIIIDLKDLSKYLYWLNFPSGKLQYKKILKILKKK